MSANRDEKATQNLDRQRGGVGLATRGDGETTIEKARRRLDHRRTRIQRSLKKLAAQRQLVRKQRQRSQAVVIALVGYTNAGKSALLQALTHCESNTEVPLSEDRLFHTLDCTARSLELPHGLSAILLDTVGFVSDLPHQLIESFNSTLQDVNTASVLLHVRDSCHPESEHQKEEVRTWVVHGHRLRAKCGLFEMRVICHQRAKTALSRMYIYNIIMYRLFNTGLRPGMPRGPSRAAELQPLHTKCLYITPSMTISSNKE